MLCFWSQIMVCILVLGARCVFRRDQKKTSKVDHTYTHTHAYIHTSMHSCIHPCMHASIHPSIHTYRQTDRQTHIHTHTHIYIYIHTRWGNFDLEMGRNQKGKRLHKIRVALGPSCLMGGGNDHREHHNRGPIDVLNGCRCCEACSLQEIAVSHHHDVS